MQVNSGVHGMIGSGSVLRVVEDQPIYFEDKQVWVTEYPISV